MEVRDQEQATNGNAAKLRCLAGQAADETLTTRWRRFLDLPPAVRDKIWSALGPLLMGGSEGEVREAGMQLASAHEVAPESLMLALQACQLILQRSCEMNLDAELLRQDLTELSEGHEQTEHACTALLAQYGEAKAELRRGFCHASVLSHGKLATNCEWRVDSILSSNHGLQLDVAVPILTVMYREGEREDRITLQLSNEVISQLRGLVEVMDSRP